MRSISRKRSAAQVTNMQTEYGSTTSSPADYQDPGSLFSSSICSMDYRLEANKARGGVTYFGGVQLHNIDIYRDDGVGLRGSSRTLRHIQMDGIKDFIVAIPLNARSVVRQAGIQTCSEPGSFRILSTAKPYSATISGANAQGSFSELLARVSGAQLRQGVPGIDDLSNLPLLIRPGSGKIMKALIELGFAEGRNLSPPQARDFSNTLIQAIANAVLDAPEADKQQKALRQTAPDRLLETATRFIESNLSNPLLNCASVAAHCQVSERYLQMAFAAAGTTLVACIRNMRLHGCRAELKSPALNHHSIIEIAMRWGFENSASFSRAYKAQFGKPPRQDRAERS